MVIRTMVHEYTNQGFFKNNSGSAVFEIIFPRFFNLSKAVNDLLNRASKRKLFHVLMMIYGIYTHEKLYHACISLVLLGRTFSCEKTKILGSNLEERQNSLVLEKSGRLLILNRYPRLLELRALSRKQTSAIKTKKFSIVPSG